MIQPSEFTELSEVALQPIVLAIQEKYNDENIKPGYLHRRFLTPRYSVDGSWKNLVMDNTLIAADVVALDSSLPVKTRPKVGSATGEIPKIGTELSLNESELKQIRLMLKAGEDLANIQAVLFRDADRVYGGVLEQWEAMFLEGLSSGVVEVDIDTNVGTSVRVDYGYLPEHKANPSVVWGSVGYTPISDLIALSEKANGTIIRFMMRRAQLNQILASDEAKNLFAQSRGVENGLFAPTFEQMNAVLVTNYGFELEVVNRRVRYQKDAVNIDVEPWEAGQVIGITSENLGALVYSDVEEYTAQVGGVTYALGENNLLVKQYRQVRPSLKQFTASEAVSMPVINANNVYVLDTTEVAV